jgi:hypothetical protein
MTLFFLPSCHTLSLSTHSFYEVFSWQDVRLSFNVSGNGACVVSGIAPGVPSIDLDIDQITDGTTKIVWTPSVIISNVEYETIGIGIGFIMPDGSITTVRKKKESGAYI